MDDILTRFIEDMGGRVHGPMSFRLIMQPCMAILFAILDGKKDASEGKPPYFWTMFTTNANRAELLKSGWKAVGKIFILAMILDAIYQYRVINWFYPGEALVVAIVLAIIPYLLLRGPANRLFAMLSKKA